MSLCVPLLVIGGPTATGKTEAAIRVARSVGGEIVSADSMQIYRGLDIGTAKPTAAERAAVRFHLVDCVDIDRRYTVADFQRDAEAAIRQIHGRGLLPILCGGTGLYIRAVLEGFSFPAAEPAAQARVRRELEEQLAASGAPAMHARLSRVDPVSAQRISPTDARRIVRALEVSVLTGEPMDARRRVDGGRGRGYNVRHFVLNRPRPALYAAIDGRVDRMLQSGWLDEVRRVHAAGHDRGLQALQAIGYRHLLQWLDAQDRRPRATTEAPAATAAIHDAELIETIKRDTRRFAKRQLTWFRRETGAQWLQWADENDYDAAVRQMLRSAQALHARRGGPVAAGLLGTEEEQ